MAKKPNLRPRRQAKRSASPTRRQEAIDTAGLKGLEAARKLPTREERDAAASKVIKRAFNRMRITNKKGKKS